jgi:hypothetical protein
MAASGSSVSVTRTVANAVTAAVAQPVFTELMGLQDAQTHRCLAAMAADPGICTPPIPAKLQAMTTRCGTGSTAGR